MLTILLFIVLFPPCALIIGFFVACIDTISDYLDEWSESRKYRKELDEKIKFYEAVYENSEDDKPYWLARIWNLKYERACLK